MATPKHEPILSDNDRKAVQELMGLEMYYARRDATTLVIGKQHKTTSKIRFDQDRFRRLQIIFAAIEALTGLRPIERIQPSLDDLMSRMGRTFEEVPSQQSVNDDSIPWDMNTPF